MTSLGDENDKKCQTFSLRKTKLPSTSTPTKRLSPELKFTSLPFSRKKKILWPGNNSFQPFSIVLDRLSIIDYNQIVKDKQSVIDSLQMCTQLLCWDFQSVIIMRTTCLHSPRISLIYWTDLSGSVKHHLDSRDGESSHGVWRRDTTEGPYDRQPLTTISTTDFFW